MHKHQEKPLLRWDFCDRPIHTEYGPMTYKSWCRREIKRIGGELKLIVHKERAHLLCAVFVNGSRHDYQLPPKIKPITGRTVLMYERAKKYRYIDSLAESRDLDCVIG